MLEESLRAVYLFKYSTILWFKISGIFSSQTNMLSFRTNSLHSIDQIVFFYLTDSIRRKMEEFCGG